MGKTSHFHPSIWLQWVHPGASLFQHIQTCLTSDHLQDSNQKLAHAERVGTHNGVGGYTSLLCSDDAMTMRGACALQGHIQGKGYSGSGPPSFGKCVFQKCNLPNSSGFFLELFDACKNSYICLCTHCTLVFIMQVLVHLHSLSERRIQEFEIGGC